LIALLEAALADDQAEHEGAPFHAVDLLGALGDARAVPILLRCLEQDDLCDRLAPQAAAALRTLGPSALERCLAAYATTTNAAFRDRLAGVMSRCGMHHERIYARLVETLQRTPQLGANALAEYGEARALDVLAHTFDTLPLRDEGSPLANPVFIELRAAIEDLGGHLTAAQHQTFRGRRCGVTPVCRPAALGRGPSRRACLAHAPAGEVIRGHTVSPPRGDTQSRTECPLLVWLWQEV
jgi:hypothetical protein